jgi:putative tricarboxylic transport membrane protein
MKETRQLRAGENLFAVLMLVFSLFVLVGAYKISGFSSVSSPGTVPMGAAAVMVIAMVMQLVSNRKQKKPDFPGFKAELAHTARDAFSRTFIIYLFIVVIYVVLIKPLHFMPSSFLFLLASIVILRGASTKKAVIISVCMLAAIYFIFHYVFRVFLP